MLFLFFSIYTSAGSDCRVAFEKEKQQTVEEFIQSLESFHFPHRLVAELVRHFLDLKPEEALALRGPKLSPEQQRLFEKTKQKVNNLIKRFGVSIKPAIAQAVGGNVSFRYLFKKGFTDAQIGQMIELRVLAERRHTLFGREAITVKEKRNLLRQAGFTEAEIKRIPVFVMQTTFNEKYATASLIFFTVLGIMFMGAK